MHYKKKSLFLLIPGLTGFVIFYIFPFIFSFYYSLINNPFEKKFVGLANFIRIIKNEYFRLALKNTFLFTGIGVPLLILFSFIISILFVMLGDRIKPYRIAFIIPMLLPTAGIVLVWKILFHDDSHIMNFVINTTGSLGSVIGVEKIPIYMLFIWKNCGYNIILFISGISSIPKEIYEASDIDGANMFQKHFYITSPLLLPTTFFVVILSLVNSFKIFKEIYLFFGTDYPSRSVYVIQYYMNNHFHKLNYQNLSAGAIIFAFIVYIIVAVGYKLENKLNREVW